ncbi:hypothetical protein RSAG8_01721, partial [Rhizoctonia solani AG-8 WAC10335]
MYYLATCTRTITSCSDTLGITTCRRYTLAWIILRVSGAHHHSLIHGKLPILASPPSVSPATT